MLALAIGEILVVSLLFSFETDVPRWRNPVVLVRSLALGSIVAGLSFVVMTWPSRAGLVARWLLAIRSRRALVPVLAHLAVLACLLPATIALSASASQAPVAWGWFWAYSVLLLALAGSLALIAAPWTFWRHLLARERAGLVLAAGMGATALGLGELAKTGWGPLAEATLVVAYSLLAVLEPTASIDLPARLLRAGNFSVYIDDSCSGYEGIGLVLAFLSLYLWTFRDRLRFPHAFLLLPAGALAIWLLNSVRLAVLVAIGARVSPAVALNGFHSQGGWIAFLAVTVGIMCLADRMPLVTAGPRQSRQIDDADRMLISCLTPFIALMLGTIAMQAAQPFDHWLYVVKAGLVAAAILALRRRLIALVGRIDAVSVGLGLAVGAAWIWTDPAAGARTPLAEWIVAQTPLTAAVWLALRGLGTVVLVPIAEELAFRGVLYRWLISRDFDKVPYTQVSLVALLVSALAFGALHERWLAGTGAGLVFTLAMLRTGRLSSAVAAHMAANAAIFVWALVARQWTLL